MPVSVIMPAFNAERFIETAIRSLLTEGADVDLDIVVVDDGSIDGTWLVAERLSKESDHIRLFRNPRKGIASARNTGLEHLLGDCGFVAFLDADDICYPGRIGRQRSMLIADPTIDALYGRLEMFKVQDETASRPAPNSPTKIIRGPYLQSAMFRPEAIRKIGPFDETFRQGDDTDFILRLIELDLRLVLDHGIAAYYRRHDTNVTLNVEEMQREFMRASLRWAARRRRRGAGPFPEVYSDLFLRRDEIEGAFEV
jgi:glycosyltransferase involved in cell wall biosynthesis